MNCIAVIISGFPLGKSALQKKLFRHVLGGKLSPTGLPDITFRDPNHHFHLMACRLSWQYVYDQFANGQEASIKSMFNHKKKILTNILVSLMQLMRKICLIRM